MCEIPKNTEIVRYTIERVKYQLVLSSIRKKEGFVPEDGSELYVNGVPENASIVELYTYFSSVGEIFEIRLLVQEDGNFSRGIAYVSYMNPEQATSALRSLKGNDFRNGAQIRLERSYNNKRIFIGGIPLNKTKDQVWQELIRLGFKNIVDVIMYRSYNERSNNRGYVFIEFKTHEEAAHFRAKTEKSLYLWGHIAIVDWSVPYMEPTWEDMQEVKVLHLLNLSVTDTYEDIYALVTNFVEATKITKVFKFKNYAFIHLKTREDAEILLRSLQDHFKYSIVQVSWSKPPNKYSKVDYRQNKVNKLASRQTQNETTPSPQTPKKPPTAEDLKNLGITPEYLRELFHSMDSDESSPKSNSSPTSPKTPYCLKMITSPDPENTLYSLKMSTSPNSENTFYSPKMSTSSNAENTFYSLKMSTSPIQESALSYKLKENTPSYEEFTFGTWPLQAQENVLKLRNLQISSSYKCNEPCTSYLSQNSEKVPSNGVLRSLKAAPATTNGFLTPNFAAVPITEPKNPSFITTNTNQWPTIGTFMAPKKSGAYIAPSAGYPVSQTGAYPKHRQPFRELQVTPPEVNNLMPRANNHVPDQKMECYRHVATSTPISCYSGAENVPINHPYNQQRRMLNMDNACRRLSFSSENQTSSGLNTVQDVLSKLTDCFEVKDNISELLEPYMKK